MPVSCTLIRHRAIVCRLRLTVTVPPSGIACTALRIRFANTRCIRWGVRHQLQVWNLRRNAHTIRVRQRLNNVFDQLLDNDLFALRDDRTGVVLEVTHNLVHVENLVADLSKERLFFLPLVAAALGGRHAFEAEPLQIDNVLQTLQGIAEDRDRS